MKEQVKVFKDADELNNFAAEKFVEIANEAIEQRGSFAVTLAGGSTPKALYQLLASEKFRDKVDWTKVFFFFGDERNVLPEDTESNFRMANESLFGSLKIANDNIFRWQTEFRDENKIAEDYAKTSRKFFNAENHPSAHADGTDFGYPSAQADGADKFPRFDLILLGMGADGHTASLFPFSEALHETEKFAVANPVEKLDTTRLTLTFPVINNARNVIFLVAGEEKAETLRDVLEGEFEPDKLPSQNVEPTRGNLFWLTDEKAASFLQKK